MAETTGRSAGVQIALTAFWAIYIIGFAVFSLTGQIAVLGGAADDVVITFAAVHFAMVLLGVVLIIAYLVHISRNTQRIEQRGGSVVAWALGVLFVGPIVMPIYWSRFVRPSAREPS